MKAETKYRLLIAFSVVCFAGLLIQAYFLFDIYQRNSSLQTNESDIPASIEERLEAALSNSNSNSSLTDPNNWPGQFFSRDPFASVRQMQQQMDSLLNSFSTPGITQYGGLSFGVGTPSLNLTETDEEYQVYIPIPEQQEIEISTDLEANLLTISGTLSRNIDESNNNITSSIMTRSQFSRSFDLPKPVDELGIYTEQSEDGIIVGVPKKVN